MANYQNIIISLAGGVLPALLWLWFWLKEDRKPEPKVRIVFSFLLGMFSVLLVSFIQVEISGLLIKLEQYLKLIPKNFSLFYSSTLLSITIFASTEEIIKFLAAYFGSSKFKEAEEPIDFIIYTVSAALGFAALENSLFIIKVFVEGGTMSNIVASGGMRFLGATLLHIISSATIGVFLAMSFKKDPETKKLSGFAGIIFAIILHTIYNFSIINVNTEFKYLVFLTVWFFIILLILILEKIKYLDGNQETNTNY